MSAASAAKLAWLSAIVAAVMLVSLWGREPQASAAKAEGQSQASRLHIVALDGGMQGLADAGDHITPLRHYERIASGSAVADEILLALSEPERIVMLTEYGHRTAPRRYLWGARAAAKSGGDVEQLREQHIDLFVLNHMGAPAQLARAREAGIEVYNLGDMRGLATLPTNIEAIATLLGDRTRGLQLIESLQRRMNAVAADIPQAQRKQAMYVSAYAGQLFGGAAHTSYHDVLTAAGLIDVAAGRFADWPHYDPEQLLTLDPEIIVTTQTSLPQLCRVHGLDHLRACKNQGALIGMPDALMENAGLSMLDAAEQLRARVYGPIAAP